MRKKKLLFRIERLNGEDTEKHLINLLENLEYSKYEVDFLLDNKEGIYLKRIPKQVGLFSIIDGKEFFSKEPIIRNLQKICRELYWGLYRLFPRFVYELFLGEKRKI